MMRGPESGSMGFGPEYEQSPDENVLINSERILPHVDYEEAEVVEILSRRPDAVSTITRLTEVLDRDELDLEYVARIVRVWNNKEREQRRIHDGSHSVLDSINCKHGTIYLPYYPDKEGIKIKVYVRTESKT